MLVVKVYKSKISFLEQKKNLNFFKSCALCKVWDTKLEHLYGKIKFLRLAIKWHIITAINFAWWESKFKSKCKVFKIPITYVFVLSYILIEKFCTTHWNFESKKVDLCIFFTCFTHQKRLQINFSIIKNSV